MYLIVCVLEETNILPESVRVSKKMLCASYAEQSHHLLLIWSEHLISSENPLSRVRTAYTLWNKRLEIENTQSLLFFIICLLQSCSARSITPKNTHFTSSGSQWLLLSENTSISHTCPALWWWNIFFVERGWSVEVGWLLYSLYTRGRAVPWSYCAGKLEDFYRQE